VGLERCPLSLVNTIEEVLERKKIAAPVQKTQNTALRIRHADHVGTNLADKRRSLGRYSSLADSGHGVYFFYVIITVGLAAGVSPPLCSSKIDVTYITQAV
jgi:hypothetical protein